MQIQPLSIISILDALIFISVAKIIQKNRKTNFFMIFFLFFYMLIPTRNLTPTAIIFVFSVKEVITLLVVKAEGLSLL